MKTSLLQSRCYHLHKTNFSIFYTVSLLDINCTIFFNFYTESLLYINCTQLRK